MDSGGIDRQCKPIDLSPSHNVGSQDLVDIFLRFKPVPNALWIDHHGWPVLAYVHAARVIDADTLYPKGHRQTAHQVT